MQNKASLTETGFIGLTKKKKNLINSNAVGAAAFSGKKKMLEFLLSRMSGKSLEFEASEEQDRLGVSSKGKLEKEISKYTPLMLNIVSGEHNFDCFKVLLQHNAEYTRIDSNGNTILHIAAMYDNCKVLEYTAKNLKVDIFARNKAGETALSIAQSKNNTKAAELLTECSSELDTSKKLAESLINELEKEEEQNEEAQNKRKLKKWRNKINKLAKSLNITPEEVEERLKKEEEEKVKKAEEDRRKEIERVKQAEIDEQKQKEELRKQILEERKRIQQEEEAERRREEQQYREEMEERRREQAAKRDRMKSEARERREQERPRREHRNEEAAPTQKKERTERVKSAVRKPVETEQRETRQSRHTTEANTPRADTQREKSLRKASKSVARDEMATENKLANEEAPAEKKVFGLGGEMALAAGSKKAQQRLKKKLNQAQKEEEDHLAVMERVAREKAEAKDKAEKEDRDRLRE